MKKIVILMGLLLSTLVFAETEQQGWLAADKAVLNYLEAIGKLQTIKQVPIRLPQQLPNNQPYYMTVKRLGHNAYVIYFDKTKQCDGKKICNVGTIIAKKYKNPQIYYSRDNKVLTEEVTLTNQNKAYFTPAHAMGDFWPARIEWRDGLWLMQLSWRGDEANAKQVLTKIADQI